MTAMRLSFSSSSSSSVRWLFFCLPYLCTSFGFVRKGLSSFSFLFPVFVFAFLCVLCAETRTDTAMLTKKQRKKRERMVCKRQPSRTTTTMKEEEKKLKSISASRFLFPLDEWKVKRRGHCCCFTFIRWMGTRTFSQKYFSIFFLPSSSSSAKGLSLFRAQAAATVCSRIRVGALDSASKVREGSLFFLLVLSFFLCSCCCVCIFLPSFPVSAFSVSLCSFSVSLVGIGHAYRPITPPPRLWLGSHGVQSRRCGSLGVWETLPVSDAEGGRETERAVCVWCCLLLIRGYETRNTQKKSCLLSMCCLFFVWCVSTVFGCEFMFVCEFNKEADGLNGIGFLWVLTWLSHHRRLSVYTLHQWKIVRVRM